ncbi:twinkle homolog protein, chloroplastic/mitochondrial-like isoform X1 [Brassica napus]|uniref:twinkle homolog protein, chloroplastic/mitochondrial isoform X1 n=1 Tax=Brassica oleracea var. oleracea TaxID=109376 RepID=UPI0006A6C530|nr:PREDICTED: twinkle homolog protein, chloroplastic/mitochondrial isoform X1 [Brassica oleracea var. oleracea]XP_048613016.1 twinkle homolog protein, chloroplastic/mitochondrial-like isoform X1 [Brassica napus]
MRFLLRLPQTHLRKLSSSMSVLMGSKQFLEFCLLPSFAASSPSCTRGAQRQLSSVSRRFRPVLASRPVSKSSPYHQRPNGVSPYTSISRAPNPVDPEDGAVQSRLANLRLKLADNGIDAQNCPSGQYSGLICPECEGGDSGEKSLSLFIAADCSSATWNCFRGKCGLKGGVRVDGRFATSVVPMEKAERKVTVESLELEPLCDEIEDYFAARMISAETLKRNRVMQKRIGDEIVIAFTYWQRGELVSCKYRYLTKKFFQEKNTRRIFYGLDDIEKSSEIIIVEGEIDKLAMEEAGFRNCVSVPDGAPASVSSKETPSEEKDTKYKFLWNCNDYLKKASRIVIATDGDGAGQALAEEVARRLGKERCWRVKWPKKSEDEHYKDANEVLMSMGPHSLSEAVRSAEPYPIQGLFSFKDFFDEIDAYYHRTHGHEYGVSTGWKTLDNFYSVSVVVPGELTVVTGVPNSGKSEWIDALLCNLNHSVGWKFALCSMENKVRDHGRKLLEKHVKKPFFDADYGRSVPRMSVEELDEGKLWLDDTFTLIRCELDSLPSIGWVLERAKAAVLRHGIRGLVIDPYNELDHQRTQRQTETEYVSQMLTKIKRFAQHHSCHVWFVAHPKQLQQWDGGPPNLYDISGSAHFINKCDNGIVIHRNRDEKAGPLDLVQICVRKVRNKVAGQIGDAYLCYDRATGLFSDSPITPEKPERRSSRRP